MHHFYRNAALLGLAYLEARILKDEDMVHHIRSLTPAAELKVSINQAVLYITQAMSNYTDIDIDSPLEAIQKTRHSLIKQIINI